MRNRALLGGRAACTILAAACGGDDGPIAPLAAGDYSWWVHATTASGAERRSKARGIRIAR